LNEAHALSWMTRATRWFQIHNSESWKRPLAKRGILGHYEWLKQEHDFPIYLQYWNEEVPSSVAYPLQEISDLFFKNFYKGDKKIKYFTSTFAYMMGVALLEGRQKDKPDVKPFDRIEIYGFELSDEIEYVKQKACGEFWIGMALGMGVEVYTPPNNQLLWSGLYGGNEQGAGW